MEQKIDALFDMMQHLTGEVSGMRTEMNLKFKDIDARFAQMDQRFEAIDTRFEQMDRRIGGLENRFDQLEKQMNSRFELVGQRFDAVDDKLENLSTETRSYFKRLEDSTYTHQSVLQQLSYKVNVHDGQIAEIREKLQ